MCSCRTASRQGPTLRARARRQDLSGVTVRSLAKGHEERPESSVAFHDMDTNQSLGASIWNDTIDSTRGPSSFNTATWSACLM